MASKNTGSHLSQGKGGKLSNEGASGPIPQHKRLAMGQDVDGKSNPYGSDSAGGKPTTHGKKA